MFFCAYRDHASGSDWKSRWPGVADGASNIKRLTLFLLWVFSLIDSPRRDVGAIPEMDYGSATDAG
jgi:hypothetical protein